MSHFAVTRSILLLLPTVSDMKSESKKELVLPSSPCPGVDSIYLAIPGWWDKESLNLHPASFPSVGGLVFSFRAMGPGLL